MPYLRGGLGGGAEFPVYLNVGLTCLTVYTHHTASVSARLSDCEDIIPVSYVATLMSYVATLLSYISTLMSYVATLMSYIAVVKKKIAYICSTLIACCVLKNK